MQCVRLTCFSFTKQILLANLHCISVSGRFPKGRKVNMGWGNQKWSKGKESQQGHNERQKCLEVRYTDDKTNMTMTGGMRKNLMSIVLVTP